MKKLIHVKEIKKTDKAILIETDFYPVGYYDSFYAIKEQIWIPISAIELKENRHGSFDFMVKDWVIKNSIKTIKPTNGKEEDYIMQFVGIEDSEYSYASINS